MSYSDAPLMLSASDGTGAGILVNSSSGPGTLIHESSSDSTVTDYLELTCSNLHTADVLLTLLWGITTDESRAVKVLIEAQKGERQLTIPKPIRQGAAVYAYAAVPNVITIFQGGGTCRVTQTTD